VLLQCYARTYLLLVGVIFISLFTFLFPDSLCINVNRNITNIYCLFGRLIFIGLVTCIVNYIDEYVWGILISYSCIFVTFLVADCNFLLV